MVKYIGIKPDVCHLNEGHAAFMALERIRDFYRVVLDIACDDEVS